MNETPKVATGRRAFLKRAAVAGGAATVAVAGGAAVADVASDGPVKTDPEQGAKGYRVTPHVEAYYRSARF